VKFQNNALSKARLVGHDRASVEDNAGLLEVQLISGPEGCLARFTGDLIEETRSVLWGVEEILLHDVRVVLDLSGISSFDSSGLEAALGLMDAVRSAGGSLKIADGQ
jgi:hypothetical protein